MFVCIYIPFQIFSSFFIMCVCVHKTLRRLKSQNSTKKVYSEKYQDFLANIFSLLSVPSPIFTTVSLDPLVHSPCSLCLPAFHSPSTHTDIHIHILMEKILKNYKMIFRMRYVSSTFGHDSI